MTESEEEQPYIYKSIAHHLLDTPNLNNLEATQISMNFANNQEITLRSVYNPYLRKIDPEDLNILLD